MKRYLRYHNFIFSNKLAFLFKFWNARLNIERSKAIKCPTVAYQLAGCKRIQQELFKEGVVEKFIKDDAVCQKLRAVFVEQYSFNVQVFILFKPNSKNIRFLCF